MSACVHLATTYRIKYSTGGWFRNEAEAFDPSWSIPDLARSVAKDIANPAYTLVNKPTYSWEDK